MTFPHEEKTENEKPEMTTFKFKLHDGTGGTYRSDKAKNEDDARKELEQKYWLTVATVVRP